MSTIQIGSLNVDQDSLQINRVVILPDEHAAQLFMEKVFPICSGYIVASEDRAYPKNPILNHMVFEKLQTDPQLALVVFGFDSLKSFRPLTNRILVMDEIILSSSTVWKDSEPFRQDWNAQKISAMIRSFFRQWERMERVGHYSFQYKNYKGYDREKLGWIIELMQKS